MSNPSNEVVFSPTGGAFEPAYRPEPPAAPEAPATGMANVVTETEPEALTGVVQPDWQSEAWQTYQDLPRTAEESEGAYDPPKKKRKRERITRLNPQGLFILVVSLVAVFALMASSFATSFSSILQAVDDYTPIPDQLVWLPPVFIDLAILAYTCSLFWFRYGGQPIKRTVFGLLFFAALSIVINVAHTVDFWQEDLSSYQSWIGVAIVASAPIAVLLASEEISRLAFEEPEK